MNFFQYFEKTFNFFSSRYYTWVSRWFYWIWYNRWESFSVSVVRNSREIQNQSLNRCGLEFLPSRKVVKKNFLQCTMCLVVNVTDFGGEMFRKPLVPSPFLSRIRRGCSMCWLSRYRNAVNLKIVRMSSSYVSISRFPSTSTSSTAEWAGGDTGRGKKNTWNAMTSIQNRSKYLTRLPIKNWFNRLLKKQHAWKCDYW